jgi:membrane-bound metal-dependent hydrolase YbcI (DUF457 family)
MMGKTHALSGAMAFGLVAVPAAPLAHLHPRELVLGTVVTAGAAVLPDIDHPGSGVSRTFGPLTRVFARLVGWISGGHRNGTHSLLGAAVFNLAVFGATALYAQSLLWLVGGLALSILLAAAGLLIAAAEPPGRGKGKPAYKRRWHGVVSIWIGSATVSALAVAALLFPRHTGVGVLAALLILTMAAVARLVKTRRLFGVRLKHEWDDALPIPVTVALLALGADLRIVPFAVLLGVLTHIAGDMITLGGCPLAWPRSQTMRGPQLFRTNSPIETGPITLVCLAVFAVTACWNTGILTALGA